MFQQIFKLKTASTAASVGADKSYRLCITDLSTGIQFLIDSGADVSVIACKDRCKKATDYVLYAANGTLIETYGTKTITLDLGLRRPIRWTFILANVDRSIIGADLLAKNQLMIDLHGRKLVDKITNISQKVQLSTKESGSVKAINTADPYHQILARYPDITKPESFKNTPKHNVVHHIITQGPPVFEKPRPLNPQKYKAAKQEFERMMDLGICRPSTSPWANPLHVVKKKNGELRPCGDYRRLNAVTEPDRYPIPRLLDFTYIIKGKTILSKIDIRRAYHSISVAEDDVPKTAIVTPFGSFEFLKLNFGLRNAAQSFQRFIHEVLKPTQNTFCYLDDILIASENQERHEQDLKEVFERLDQYGITINTSKCEFGKTELKFLGYNVTCDGIQPDEEKVKAIMEYKQPETIEELRRFLGLINFYRSNIPKAAESQSILDKYLHNSKRNDKTKVAWTQDSIDAYNKCKQLIQDAVMLAHPDSSAPLVLITDASNTCVGGALHQRTNGQLQPLAFFSKKLTSAQIKYSTYDRELLAIYLAIKHFRYLIEARELTVLSDHKPLSFALSKKESKNDSPRRLRQLDFIAQFCNKIEYIEGEFNNAADFLSRIEEIQLPHTFNYEELYRSQMEDTELENLRQNPKIEFKSFNVPYSKHDLIFETSTNKARLYLPHAFRAHAISSIHALSHPGVAATRRLVAERYFWHGMNGDVTKYVKSCIPCQKAKVYKHTITPLGEFEKAERFMHCHIDLIGPLPPSQEFRYCLTMIDRITKWPEIIPIKDMSADTVAEKFIENWIARFGCPVKVTTDQGRQFESQLFTQLTKKLGIDKIHTTAYNPKANGQVERFHRTLKAAIMARCGESNQWARELPLILLGLRAAIKKDSGYSPAQMTLGHSLRLPGDFFEPPNNKTKDINETDFTQNLMATLANIQPKTRINTQKQTFVNKDLQSSEFVFVRQEARKSLTPPYAGPFKVIRKTAKHYTVQIGSRNVVISLDRLKPAYVTISGSQGSTDTNDHNKPSPTVEHNTSQKQPTVVTRAGRTVRKTVRFDI